MSVNGTRPRIGPLLVNGTRPRIELRLLQAVHEQRIERLIVNIGRLEKVDFKHNASKKPGKILALGV